MTELKPCKCNSEELFIFPNESMRTDLAYAVICKKCKAIGPFVSSKQQAIDAWNKRS